MTDIPTVTPPLTHTEQADNTVNPLIEVTLTVTRGPSTYNQVRCGGTAEKNVPPFKTNVQGYRGPAQSCELVKVNAASLMAAALLDQTWQNPEKMTLDWEAYGQEVIRLLEPQTATLASVYSEPAAPERSATHVARRYIVDHSAINVGLSHFKSDDMVIASLSWGQDVSTPIGSAQIARVVEALRAEFPKPTRIAVVPEFIPHGCETITLP